MNSSQIPSVPVLVEDPFLSPMKDSEQKNGVPLVCLKPKASFCTTPSRLGENATASLSTDVAIEAPFFSCPYVSLPNATSTTNNEGVVSATSVVNECNGVQEPMVPEPKCVKKGAAHTGTHTKGTRLRATKAVSNTSGRSCTTQQGSTSPNRILCNAEVRKDTSSSAAWNGTDVLDALLMFGSTHSPVCFSGWMGLMRLLIDMVVSSYRVRDLDPRVADTVELAFSTADPVMALGMVLLFLPSAPQTCELLLQHSTVSEDTLEFIAYLEETSSQFLRNETTKAHGAVFSLPMGQEGEMRFPTIQSYTVACRSAWVNK
jgi:hypothetical protein